MATNLTKAERNDKLIRLAEILGLDPSEITDLQAEWSGTGPVEVTYEGKIFVNQARWLQILGELHDDA
jgi:hypothetical protein